MRKQDKTLTNCCSLLLFDCWDLKTNLCIIVRVLLCVSCVPASCVCHVSIFGLFPVLVKCHYELNLVQPCLSHYLWFTCVFIVLSVQIDVVWSTRYSRCSLSLSPALSCLVLPWSALICLDVSLKTIIWVYVLVCVFLFLPRVCTVTIMIIGLVMVWFWCSSCLTIKVFCSGIQNFFRNTCNSKRIGCSYGSYSFWFVYAS